MLAVIQEAGLLEKSDLAVIEKLQGELFEALEKNQIFRTRTEMEVSVLNDVKFPTAPSKYWQALREQVVMFDELVLLSFEARKNRTEIKILLRDMEGKEDKLDRELLQIEMEKKRFILSAQVRVAKDRIREIQDWSEIKAREAEKMDEVDLANVGNHQLVSYTKRWIKQSLIMGSKGSPAERQNLLGQLRSGLLVVTRAGLLESVLAEFPRSVQKNIRADYSAERLDG